MYEGKTACGIEPMQLRMPTLMEDIQRRLEKAKEEVQRNEELLTLLAQNPEVERIFSLMQKNY